MPVRPFRAGSPENVLKRSNAKILCFSITVLHNVGLETVGFAGSNLYS